MTQISNSHFTCNPRNQTALNNHLNQLFNNYSKLLPLRLDFHYTEFSSKTYDCAYSDMYLLYSALKKECFGVVGFCFSLEYSSFDRLHIHAVFYINGQNHRGYYCFFEQIKYLWQSIISDALSVYCCNLSGDYINNALQTIHYQDTKTKTYLQHVLNYIGKNEQKENIPDMYQTGVSVIHLKSNAGKPRLIK